ncbi:cytochrome P450 4C1-like [Colias croceus]|uniref:cytochrome P450 4C1-like n=1 Tax=Colias crocea TaxID=72248 RepID=UPI001E280A66|nr:cytochrome P450 4C1-like [Colias croceus]
MGWDKNGLKEKGGANRELETGMGVTLNSQEDRNNTFLTATNEAIRYCCERMFQPWLQPDWLYKLFPQHEKLMQAIKIIHDFTDEVIEKRKNLQKCPENDNHTLDQLQNREITFLDILINHGGIHCYSNTELREEVLTFIVAATDTSAVSICFTLKLLAKYPEIQQRVYEEIYSIFGDSERLLEKDDLPKLQYLERVIKETIRLFPPVPFIIRTATEDFPLNKDITIPKGAGVTVSMYGLHRNPHVWGLDAECFDPDRFLPERTKGMHPCAYIPFSYGPRNCLGYQYAMMSMKTALSTILRRYRVIGEPENNPVPKIRVKFDIMMKAVDGFEVALELR